MEQAIVHVKQSYIPSPSILPIKNFFLIKYGQFPRKISIKPSSKEHGMNVVFHVKSVLDQLSSNNDIYSELPIIRYCFHCCSKKYYAFQQLISLGNIHGIMIYLNECIWVTNYTNNSKKFIHPDYTPNRHFLITEQIDLFYLIEHEEFVQKLAYDLINDDTLSLIEPQIAMLRLIGKIKNNCHGFGSLYLAGNTYIRKPYINDLAVSYGGQDFLNVHNKIVTWINKKDANGLVLLHGAPGSGKTHYIRYLLHCIKNDTKRCLIYIPSDMINDLSNPTLLPLLIKNPNSLLIIEDAEGSLSRSRLSNQSVSNLLNFSDGLLNDGIQVQILATFNCPLISLDSALLRPGRLIVQYCFPSILNIENARYLAQSIGVKNINEINEPLSLANIYDMKDEKFEENQDEITSSHCKKCYRLHDSILYEGEEEE